MEGYDAGLKLAGTFEHLLKIVRSWHRDLRHIEDALPAMADVPTLLLWGERDMAVYASSASELHRRLHNSAVLIMKGVGHLPYEEVPEEFNRVVCDFLLHHSPATPLEAAQLQPGTTA